MSSYLHWQEEIPAHPLSQLNGSHRQELHAPCTVWSTNLDNAPSFPHRSFSFALSSQSGLSVVDIGWSFTK